MNSKIFKYPNPCLRVKCQEIDQIDEEVRQIGLKMIEIMKENQGIGLAASQIGESKKMLVIQGEKGPEVFINPKIIKKSKTTEKIEEGCLSFPEIFLKIKRSKNIELEALNLKGEKTKLKAKDLLAIIFQHEIDHLNGVLFIDRAGFWQKIKLIKKLKKCL